MELDFEAVAEDQPGPRLRELFRRHWPGYRRWYLSQGEEARPTYLACERAVRRHLPEWEPLWKEISALLGGGDLETRFLSQFRPPPYTFGCSQAVWTRDRMRLVRNYDYHPRLCERLILRTRWNGRGVIASSDCLVGALDGMNEDGLAVSLAFGGRRLLGEGFAAPLVLRVLLQACSTVKEAGARLKEIPVHMAYNILIADRAGDYATAYMQPGSPPRLVRTAASTNHQDRIFWARHARATATLGREARLNRLLDDPQQTVDSFHRAFLEPPLYNTEYVKGFGTLYTAGYDLQDRTATFSWPDRTQTFGFRDFEEGVIRVDVPSPGTPSKESG